MASTSKIEWTESTWNPLVGCSIVSKGCTNCYAMNDAWRKSFNPKTPAYKGLTTRGPNGDKPPVWTGEVRRNSDRAFYAPLHRKKPTMYFVNSMSDLFHEDVPDELIDEIFAIMALTPHHTYQVLTKRSARMRAYFDNDRLLDAVITQAMRIDAEVHPRDHEFDRWPLPNVWLGVSTEDQRTADERIPDLLNTPAAVRFVSLEPLLGAANMEPWLDWPDDNALLPPRDGEPFGCVGCDAEGPSCDCPNNKAVFVSEVGPKDETGLPEYVHVERITLDWIIVGGESGSDARPMHPDWPRDIRDQCEAARGEEGEARPGTKKGTPFFFKQWGDWAPLEDHPGRTDWMLFYANGEMDLPDDCGPDGEGGEVAVVKVGKKAAGRLLDGETHNAMPGGEAE